MAAIRLIAGLGNPGPQYQDTRHNIGAEWVAELAGRFGIALRDAKKFKGFAGRGEILGHDTWLLLPTTFMNLSGESLGALARFYNIEPQETLVAYDEVAFEPGVVRLKSGGGANGHNGIKSVIAGFGGNRDFHRLRIGVGHPGSPDRMMAYLTGTRMPQAERAAAERACAFDDSMLAALLDGRMQEFMNTVHAAPSNAPADKQTNEDA